MRSSAGLSPSNANVGTIWVRHPRGVSATPKPENQHYIPKFMLRLFGHGDGNGLIWTHDKTTGVTSVKSVNKVASGPDFYAVNYPDRERDMALERVFNRFETMAAPVIKSIASLAPGIYPLDPATRDLLAGWLALSKARVPETIDQTLAMAKFAVAVETDMLLRNPEEYRRRSRAKGATASNEELEVERLDNLSAHEDRRLIVEPAPETGLTSLGIAVDQVRPVISGMRWDLLRRRRFPCFVLGDQPVTIGRPPDHPNFLGAGIATTGVEVYAPLSPEALLVATHEPHDGSLHVMAPDDRPPRPSLTADWSLRPNLTAFVSAPQMVFGRSQGDVEAVRLALAPSDRKFQPGIRVSGMPKEWLTYVPEGMVAEGVDPTDVEQTSGPSPR
jgi:hypothetical protein